MISFKMYNLVGFSILIILWTNTYIQFENIFIAPQGNLSFYEQSLPIFPLPTH